MLLGTNFYPAGPRSTAMKVRKNRMKQNKETHRFLLTSQRFQLTAKFFILLLPKRSSLISELINPIYHVQLQQHFLSIRCILYLPSLKNRQREEGGKTPSKIQQYFLCLESFHTPFLFRLNISIYNFSIQPWKYNQKLAVTKR